jgi:hypothetical protein
MMLKSRKQTRIATGFASIFRLIPFIEYQVLQGHNEGSPMSREIPMYEHRQEEKKGREE